MSLSEKRLIGRTDTIDLPEFGLSELACKVDTGADTSSLHCSDIRVVETKDGLEVLEFHVLDPKHPLYSGQRIRVASFRVRKVKSSFGTTETRFSIDTKLLLFGLEWPVEFTLSDRENMRFPVLLGRRFLRKKFVVDVAKKNLSDKQRIKP